MGKKGENYVPWNPRFLFIETSWVLRVLFHKTKEPGAVGRATKIFNAES